MMEKELELKEIGPEDREEVFALSEDIWEGHDYLPELFDQWVEEGGFYKGVLDEKIIGTSKYTRQYDGVIWLEGFRVHPDFQGRGLGREMMEKFMDIVEKLDSKKIKFMTAKVNEPILHMAGDYGFELVQRYKYYVMEEEVLDEFKDETIDLSCIQRGMDEQMIDFVKSSEEYEDNYGQYLAHWTAYNMEKELIKREMESGRCYFIDDPMTAVFLYPYEPYDVLSVAFLAGEEKEKLMRFGAMTAVKRGYSRFSIKTAPGSVIDVCKKIGMEPSHVEESFLYEKS